MILTAFRKDEMDGIERVEVQARGVRAKAVALFAAA
jgi:hypothetical protein